MKRVLDGGSIGGSMGTWKKPVLVLKSFGVCLHLWHVKNTALGSAFISIVRSLFGTRGLRVFTYHLRLSLKKEYVQTQRGNLKKVINQLNLFRKVKDFPQILNLRKVTHLGIRERNSRQSNGINIGVSQEDLELMLSTLKEMGRSQFAKNVVSRVNLEIRLMYTIRTKTDLIMI